MKKLIFAAIAAIILFFGFRILTDYTGGKGQEIGVYIAPGTGADGIIKTLKEKGVIRYTSVFKAYLTDEDMLGFKSGIHEMRTNMGYADTVSELLKIVPAGDIIKVTIPEGFEMHEIAKRLEESGVVISKDFLSAAEKQYNYDFLRGISAGENYLEGYLYPATYDFTPSMDPEQIIGAMLDRFEVMLTDEYKNRAKEMGMSVHEALTLASVIEREAAAADERAIVSSVFHNRLKSETYPYLESCATVQYILGERKAVLSYEDTRINSPYNTYINSGLPPGPIASPGEESFRAALYPEDTDYLFFVASGNGKHTFSKTYEEHLRAQGE